VRGRIILKCVLMEYVKLSRYKPCRCKERRYSLYLLLTSALYGGGQRHSSAAFYPRGKDARYTFDKESGWAPEPVLTQRQEKKIPFSCSGSNPGRPVRSETLY
jgi:hypothetical protein